MTPDQARDLQGEMVRLGARLRQGHLEPADLEVVAKTLEEVLAHIAAALEARCRKPKK